MNMGHRKHKGWLGVLLAVWACNLAAVVWSAGPGTTGGDVLKVSLGARPNALGGAYSAVDADAQSVLYNPAAMSGITSPDFVFQHYAAYEEVAYELLGWSQPVEEMGTWGGALVWRHMPAIDNPGAPDAPVTATDLVLTVGAGRLWKEWLSEVPPVLDRLAAGGAVKIIYGSLREAHSVSLAADLGVTWNAPASWTLPVTVAAGVQNAGAPMRYLEQADPLPFNGRVGFSLRPWNSVRNKLVLTSDVILPLDNAPKTLVGMEYTLADILSFRAGYRFENVENLNGPSAGLGVAFAAGSMKLRLDYAYRLTLWKAYETVDNNHFISLGARF